MTKKEKLSIALALFISLSTITGCSEDLNKDLTEKEQIKSDSIKKYSQYLLNDLDKENQILLIEDLVKLYDMSESGKIFLDCEIEKSFKVLDFSDKPAGIPFNLVYSREASIAKILYEEADRDAEKIINEFNLMYFLNRNRSNLSDRDQQICFPTLTFNLIRPLKDDKEFDLNEYYQDIFYLIHEAGTGKTISYKDKKTKER